MPQLSDEDEVLVVGDTTDGPLEETEKLVASFGPHARYLACPPTEHSWGHREINFGIANAKGQWLGFNDDDDVWTPGAIGVMRQAVSVSDRPILFRFLTYHGFVVWTSRLAFMQDQIGGHCIVCPNVPGKVGTWTDRYQGDWDFIEETVNRYGGPSQIIWREEVIALGRPSPDTCAGILASAGR